MPKRRPRFTLVLTALVAATAAALLLAGRGSPRRAPTVGIGPVHACVSTRAAAQVTARSSIVITATVEAPLRVTEQASGPKGIATVTRSEVLRARDKATQPVAITRRAVARARACANGNSLTAARSEALRDAYASALAAAHADAAKGAAGALSALMRRQYPSVLAEARSKAAARAHQLALAAEPSLAAQARDQARTEAGS